MLRTALHCMTLVFVMASAVAAAEPAAKDDKLLGGMSIVGNDDAPKSLVLVPWKSSKLGDALDISRILNDGREPVDRDVFMRELNYYAIRAGASQGYGPASQ
ncbi:MAG: hypothetical protein OEY15_14510 [Myxococcales bacterium]|nr:hypothetical protein [Myxococcales bacterium]